MDDHSRSVKGLSRVDQMFMQASVPGANVQRQIWIALLSASANAMRVVLVKP